MICDIQIVPFAESDRDELTRLYDQVRAETFTWVDKETLLQSSFTTSTDGEFILVARAQTICVGFISAWKPDNFIHHLYIHAGYQGQGIGKLLFHSMAAALAFPITLKCLKKNTPALRFYEPLGFTPVSEGVSSEGDYVFLKLNR